MNSAQLVNLILAKLRRVEFLDIRNHAVLAIAMDDDNYSRWVEGILNGNTRDADGNLL